MTKDYSVEIKVRNNRLLSKMREAGFESAAALSRASGVSYGQVVHYLGLKIAPMTYGRWRASAERLSACLRCLPEDLFPARQIHEALAKNSARFTADATDIHQISASLRSLALPADEKMLLAESKNALDALLDTLTPRERNIINQRFGLIDGKEKTLGNIDGERVSCERVRGIEAKALRHLRQVAKADKRLNDALVHGMHA